MLEFVWEFVKAHPVMVSICLFLLFRAYSIRNMKEVVVEGSRVLVSSSTAEFEALLNSNNIVIADFYANWCPGCVHAAPDFARLSKVYTNVCFVKVNTDVAQDLAQKYDISVLPTFKIIVNKKEVASIRGVRKADLVENIEAVGGIALVE